MGKGGRRAWDSYKHGMAPAMPGKAACNLGRQAGWRRAWAGRAKAGTYLPCVFLPDGGRRGLPVQASRAGGGRAGRYYISFTLCLPAHLGACPSWAAEAGLPICLERPMVFLGKEEDFPTPDRKRLPSMPLPCLDCLTLPLCLIQQKPCLPR